MPKTRKSCRHRAYGLSCQSYAQLLAEAGTRCEICRLPATQNTSGRLFIDHDGTVGQWAVRGLLCHRCNSLIADKPGWDTKIPPGAGRYLADPWYRRRLAELGLSTALPVEPPEGTRVRDAHGRVWVKSWRGWRCSDGRAGSRTWGQLVAQFGPIGLTWIT